MINAILSGLIKLIIGLVSLLFYPIDLAIAAVLPDVSSLFNSVGQVINIIGNSLSYAISYVPVFPTFWVALVAIYTVKLTFPLVMYTMKLALKWYDKVKP